MTALLSAINPGFILIALGLVTCFTPVKRIRTILTVGAPLAGLSILMMADRGVALSTAALLNTELTLYYVDSLNFIFGVGFLLTAFLHGVYSLHSDDKLHQGTAMIFAGSAVAAVFSGDLMSLFIFWEIGTLSAAFLIFRAGTKAAYQTGMRFLGFHILSGVLFLDGLIYVQKKSGGFSFAEAGLMESFSHPAAKYLFAALAIKAAFPLVHTWLKDVTPKATVLGGIILPLLTTVLAVYALARLFPGLDALVWIGAIMASYAVLFAAIVNDARRILAYGHNAICGIMICAIGVGTPLALNAAAGLAFMSLIVFGLLFMTVSAVLFKTGTAKLSELGGLWRTMPFTALFTILGALALSGFPLFMGAVTLPMAISVVSQGAGLTVTLATLIGFAGLIYGVCLRLPIGLFFGDDSRERPAEVPFNMLLGMGLSALMCVLLGLPGIISGFGYEWLYSLLPCTARVNPASCEVTTVSLAGFEPYNLMHILSIMQIIFAVILVSLLLHHMLFSKHKREAYTVLDTDWFYRKWGYEFAKWIGAVWQKMGPALSLVAGRFSQRIFLRLEEAFSPRGTLARVGWNSGAAIWSAVLLGFVMMVVLLSI
ncbi:MAG: proton-conducting transporter membrane subunit [Pseudomonadota bacterium]